MALRKKVVTLFATLQIVKFSIIFLIKRTVYYRAIESIYLWGNSLLRSITKTEILFLEVKNEDQVENLISIHPSSFLSCSSLGL